MEASLRLALILLSLAEKPGFPAWRVGNPPEKSTVARALFCLRGIGRWKNQK